MRLVNEAVSTATAPTVPGTSARAWADGIRVINLRLPLSLLARPHLMNGLVDGDCIVATVDIVDGRLVPATGHAARMLDAGGRIALPRLVEPHCHLDKCHTVGRLAAVDPAGSVVQRSNGGSGLASAGERMRVDKLRWTRDDLQARAGRGLAELRASGCGIVRTHVDWTPGRSTDAREPPPAWTAIGELADTWRGALVVQRAPLVALEDLDDRVFRQAVVNCVEAAEGVLGVFVLGQSSLDKRLKTVFDHAAHHDLLLDFHVDESLDASLRGLDSIARASLASSHDRPVLCGHACALASQTPRQVSATLDRVAEAGITVAALPATNLYLQDRGAGTPTRRGMTRIHEMAAAGVPTVFGSDNVGDAYCPMGRHDPLFSLELAALAAHLDPPLGGWLPAISTRAALALGCPAVFLDEAPMEQLLLLDAGCTAEMARTAERMPLTDWMAATASATASLATDPAGGQCDG